MRTAFRDTLTALARRDPRVLLLIGDIGGGLFLDFRKAMPKQFFNMGICEQATVSVAAGLALCGFRPVVFTITPFLIERAFEQVKVDLHLMRAPVGLVGYCDTTEGPTHHPLNVEALMALVPNVRSMFPQRKEEVGPLLESVAWDGPWFLSLKPETICN